MILCKLKRDECMHRHESTIFQFDGYFSIFSFALCNSNIEDAYVWVRVAHVFMKNLCVKLRFDLYPFIR